MGQKTIEFNVSETARIGAISIISSGIPKEASGTPTASDISPSTSPSFTPTPTPSPWFADSFEGTPDPNIWNETYFCYPQKWTHHHGYISMELMDLENGQKDYQECYLALKFGDQKISRVLAEVQIIDGYADASYVGILSSCGTEFRERLSLGVGKVVLSPQGETAVPFYLEGTQLPTLVRTLVMTWNVNQKYLEASVYDGANNALLSSAQIACSEFPTYVKIGVYSIQGLSVTAVINRVEVWSDGE